MSDKIDDLRNGRRPTNNYAESNIFNIDFFLSTRPSEDNVELSLQK